MAPIHRRTVVLTLAAGTLGAYALRYAGPGVSVIAAEGGEMTFDSTCVTFDSTFAEFSGALLEEALAAPRVNLTCEPGAEVAPDPPSDGDLP